MKPASSTAGGRDEEKGVNFKRYGSFSSRTSTTKPILCAVRGSWQRTGMRVVARRSEDHEVDNVDDTDAEVVAKVLAEERRGVDHLLGELVADADEDDVWVDTLVDGVVCGTRQGSAKELPRQR